jgi:hypothetical protein
MMGERRKILLTPVRRDRGEGYLLISLVSFGVTVILTRAFLELTGFPQIGNSVLHIAHALWGGLLLFIAVLLPLAFANRWAIQSSALLSGIGIGLFIDEVGKFITQTNDYFFPPALPLIYGFFLLVLLAYLHFRRPRQQDPRTAMYHALHGFHHLLDGDLDGEKAARIEAQLAIAVRSDQEEIVSLADTLRIYLQKDRRPLSAAKPGFWRSVTSRLESSGRQLGRQGHRAIISMLLLLWLLLAIGFVVVLLIKVPTINPQIVRWELPLIIIQLLVAALMTVALFDWLVRSEVRGLRLAISGFLLSLVGLQTLYFYLSQFSAITATLLQLAFLQILLAYRRWYLGDSRSESLIATPE